MATPNPLPHNTETLAQLLRQKRAVLEQLAAVAVRQAALIESGDMTELIKLLSAKQKLINALQTAEKLLSPYRGEDPEQRVWKSPEARAACAADSQTCSRLLAQVLEMERNQEQQMMGRRDAVAMQLRQAQSAHQVASAYQPHRTPPKPNIASANVAPVAPGTLDLSTNG